MPNIFDAQEKLTFKERLLGHPLSRQSNNVVYSSDGERTHPSKLRTTLTPTQLRHNILWGSRKLSKIDSPKWDVKKALGYNPIVEDGKIRRRPGAIPVGHFTTGWRGAFPRDWWLQNVFGKRTGWVGKSGNIIRYTDR